MSYVLTNGRHYVKLTERNGVEKTRDINEAKVFCLFFIGGNRRIEGGQ